MSLTIISVDTGNKNIKTPNTQPFNSGLICHGTSAPPLSVETLRYDGKYYSLTEKRIPTMFDKTETEDFYILTLFAAAKEIAAQDGPKPAYRKDICLALGLPPTHLQELKPKYLKYFGRGGQRVEFTYNGTHYDLRVARVEVFPQGYAAVVPYLGKIRDKTRSYIIDIGGYTTDVVMLKKGGEPDLDFCESFNAGFIRMFDQVQRVVRNRHRRELDDYMVDAILRGTLDPGDDIRNAAFEAASSYARTLISSLREKGVDLDIAYPILIGGGSVLMKDVIVSELGSPEYLHVEDVRANAIGYQLLAKARMNHDEAG